jgi:acyl CoA:acetate/3-ketoacid CoA transferase alpha subunit
LALQAISSTSVDKCGYVAWIQFDRSVATDWITTSRSGGSGLARLMEVGRVRKIICSYPRTTDPVVFESLYRAGKIELEVMRLMARSNSFSLT